MTTDQAPRPTEAGAAQHRTMTAMAQERYGEPAEVLRLAEIPRPTPKAGEVVLEVRAAGVDQGVWHLVAGLPYAARLAGFGVRAPKNPVPGMDVAGVVVAVADDVDAFRPGDEVFGVGIGTYAGYARARADKLVHKPADLAFEPAGALAISGLTALQAVRDQAEVQPGERVLVLGASGGVGSYAVQVAKAFGAEVTGVASTAKLDFVRSLGADHVVDYTVEDATDGAVRYDVIIDIGGSRRVRHLRRALTPTGRLVIVGGETKGRMLGGVHRQLRALLLSPFVSQRLTTFVSRERGRDIAALRDLVVQGAVTPAVEHTYPSPRRPRRSPTSEPVVCVARRWWCPDRQPSGDPCHSPAPPAASIAPSLTAAPLCTDKRVSVRRCHPRPARRGSSRPTTWWWGRGPWPWPSSTR